MQVVAIHVAIVRQQTVERSTWGAIFRDRIATLAPTGASLTGDRQTKTALDYRARRVFGDY